MRLYPGEIKRARFYSDSATALEVETDGAWYDLTAGVEDESGGWAADPDGTVHTITVAHIDASSPPAGSIVLAPGVHPTRIRRVDTGAVLIQNTDPFMVVGLVPWPVDWGSLPRPSDSDVLRQAEELAVSALRGLTLGRVGETVVTLMPCGTSCAHVGRAWDLWPFARLVPTCGCMTGCSCSPVASVALDPPVAGIESVVVDGVTVDPGAYRVENGYLLVRTDGGNWPACASDEFIVTYSFGYPVDNLGAHAAGVLASEFAKVLTGEVRGCRLPPSVVSVTRQGVTMDMSGGVFPEGRTGIAEVDVWVRSWNPYAMLVAPSVYSPDIDRGRRITWDGS